MEGATRSLSFLIILVRGGEGVGISFTRETKKVTVKTKPKCEGHTHFFIFVRVGGVRGLAFRS